MFLYILFVVWRNDSLTKKPLLKDELIISDIGRVFDDVWG